MGFVSGITDAVADGIAEKVNSGDTTFSDPAFTDAVGTYTKWVDSGWTNPDFATATYADMPAKLQGGEIAMYPMGTWMNSAFTDPANIGFFPYPSNSGKSQWQGSTCPQFSCHKPVIPPEKPRPGTS